MTGMMGVSLFCYGESHCGIQILTSSPLRPGVFSVYPDACHSGSRGRGEAERALFITGTGVESFSRELSSQAR
jgi:hypothetical protein